MPEFDGRLLGMLVCPVSRGTLVYDGRNNELISVKAGLAYAIRDGIPILLEEEARALDEAEMIHFAGDGANTTGQ